MATDVKPDELNYDHYDSHKYDEDIIRSIPGHEELHRHIDQIIQRDYSSRGKVKALELGVGTGLTAERILRLIPNAEYTAVDFSEQMLAGAKIRLSQYNVTFIEGDYSQIELPGSQDLVVSVIGMHHQKTDDDKKRMFQRVYQALKKNQGLFVFGDLVTYKDQYKNSLAAARHYHHLVENAVDEQSLKEWAHHHLYLNSCAYLEDQIEWMKEAGFQNIEQLFEQCSTVLLVGRS